MLSKPKMILDYHACQCPRLHFSVLMWLKGCNHSFWGRNPYCHLWIMLCSAHSKALHRAMYSNCTKKLKLLQNADDCQLNGLFHWELPVLTKLQWVATAFLGECEMFVWFHRALSETCVTETPTSHWDAAIPQPAETLLLMPCLYRRGAECSWQGNPCRSLSLGIFLSFQSWNIFVFYFSSAVF